MKPTSSPASRYWPALIVTFLIASAFLGLIVFLMRASQVRPLLAAESLSRALPSPAELGVKEIDSPPLFAVAKTGDILDVFTNTWSYSTIGLVYDPDRGLVRYAHESQSSTHNPTIYDLAPAAHTIVYSVALSTQNSDWPWQTDNRTGAGYDYETGTYFLPDYNGDLSYSDDNIVEVDASGTILNVWEMDDEVSSNDSSDGSEIDSIIDIAVVPGAPPRYFVTAAYDENIVYEVDLQKTGTWWTPNSWSTVATCTLSNFGDNLGIDYDAETGQLYHSSWDTTTLLITDLDCSGGSPMNIVDSFDCPGAGGYNSGVTFIEGSNPSEVWVTDFSSDQTTRCQAPGVAPVEPGWEKSVVGVPWSPDVTVTTETSGTIQVTDVITAAEPFTLTELWNGDRLSLTGVSVQPPLADVVTATGALTVTGSAATPDVVTVTKEFWVRPCTWTTTIVSETLFVEEGEVTASFYQRRPFTVTKQAPQLQIASDYLPSVYAGGIANFTLTYTNTGGFENAVMITNTFLVTAPLVYADPEPNAVAINGTWARWDVGNLATGDRGEIDVYVYIAETLPGGIEVPIWDGIYDHVGELADEVTTTFTVLGEAVAGWTKLIDDGKGAVDWSPTVSLTLETHDTFTVTDIVTVSEGFSLFEMWAPSELKLKTWSVEPLSTQVDDSQSGVLSLSALSGPVTLTKVFTVETCSWSQTVLWEQLTFGLNVLARPVLIRKNAPVLSLTAANLSPEVHGGETVTYTLTYSNTGGYENAFNIQADFPNGVDFQTADPVPTTGTAGDPTVTWDFTGGLETNDVGAITVTVTIMDEVPPGTRLEIDNTLFDHVGVPKAAAPVTYEAGAPVWEKRVNEVVWSASRRTSVEAGDLLTITEAITSEAAFTLVDRWMGNHLTLLEAKSDDGSVSSATGLLTWTVPAAPAPMTLTKRFRVEPFTSTHTVLWENLYVGGAEWERRPVVLERLAPDLRLIKAVVPATAAPGDAITYTLTFSNAGPGMAQGIVLTDRIPISITVTAVVSHGVSITETGVTPPYVWQIADLGADQGGMITITGMLDDPLPAGLITNVAEIAADNEVKEIGTSPGGSGSSGTTDAVSIAVDGEALTCTLTGLSIGTPYAFCNGICGSVTFASLGSVSSMTVTFHQHYPSINGEGLPRQYRISADGTGFTAQLTLCYEDSELEIAGIPVGDEGKLRGFRYTGSGIWDTPGTQSTNTGGNTVTIGGVTAFSAWGIGIENTTEEPTAVTSRRLGVRPNAAVLVPAGLLALIAIGWIAQRRKHY